MPQMAPIEWLIFFLMFSIFFLIFNMIQYFYFNNFKMKMNTYKKMNLFSLNWKW